MRMCAQTEKIKEGGLQTSTDTDIYRPVPKLFKYRHQYRRPIFIQTIGLCFYIVVEGGV